MALALVLSCTGSGCASLALLNLWSEKFPKADAKNPAVEILAVWQPAEGPGLNGVPTRGFAGQIFFFTQNQSSTVEVDGKVRVYVFDDRGTVEEQAKPIHQYDFESDAWKTHAKKAVLGPGYAVFIPYPRRDLRQATCALRIKFTPNSGPILYSQMSTIVLAGPPAKPVNGAVAANATALDAKTVKPATAAATTSTTASAAEPSGAPLRKTNGAQRSNGAADRSTQAARPAAVRDANVVPASAAADDPAPSVGDESADGDRPDVSRRHRLQSAGPQTRRLRAVTSEADEPSAATVSPARGAEWNRALSAE